MLLASNEAAVSSLDENSFYIFESIYGCSYGSPLSIQLRAR